LLAIFRQSVAGRNAASGLGLAGFRPIKQSGPIRCNFV
jgi:hypothetical protein